MYPPHALFSSVLSMLIKKSYLKKIANVSANKTLAYCQRNMRYICLCSDDFHEGLPKDCKKKDSQVIVLKWYFYSYLII